MCNEQPIPYPQVLPDDRTRWTMDMATRLERQMSGDPTSIVLVATDATLLRYLGFLSARQETRLVGHPRTYWIVDYLYTVPILRGRWRGIGPALMSAALTQAEPAGLEIVELVSLAHDTQWARRGWTPTLTRYMMPAQIIQDRLARRRGKKEQSHAA
jgi:GNAT superfamily N-acetyltransferase